MYADQYCEKVVSGMTKEVFIYMFRKRLVFSVLLSLSITIVCYAEPGKAVYSIPGNSTYLNPDPYSASGEVILDLSVVSHIVTGDVDSDPYEETVYAIAEIGRASCRERV